MTKTINSKYQKEVHDALEKCQFIEETLRVYIELVIRIAKLHLTAYFPIRITTKDISKFSLGKLVKLYSRFSDNAALKSSLTKITEERNFVAHRSLLFTIGEIEDLNHMQRSLKKITDIKNRATKLHGALLEETWSLRKAAVTIELARGKKNKSAT